MVTPDSRQPGQGQNPETVLGRPRGGVRVRRHARALGQDAKDAVGTLGLIGRGIRNTLGAIALTGLATAGTYLALKQGGGNELFTLIPAGVGVIGTVGTGAWSVVRVSEHVAVVSAKAAAHVAETTAVIVEAGIDEGVHAVARGVRRARQPRTPQSQG